MFEVAGKIRMAVRLATKLFLMFVQRPREVVYAGRGYVCCMKAKVRDAMLV